MKNEIFYGDPIALNWKADDGAAATVRVQLSPFGEFTLRDGGKRSGTVQHCSRAAFEAMVANWKAMGARDILVDVDHASATGGSTEAAAWAKNLRVEEDGLCADFELTPRGRELVEGRRYRFVSPGWTLADDGTPIAICSVALTNRPNLPVKPVVNADETGGQDPAEEAEKYIDAEKGVEDCDVFLGFVRPLTGTGILKPGEKSITAQEFEVAFRVNMPRFVLADYRVVFARQFTNLMKIPTGDIPNSVKRERSDGSIVERPNRVVHAECIELYNAAIQNNTLRDWMLAPCPLRQLRKRAAFFFLEGISKPVSRD